MELNFFLYLSAETGNCSAPNGLFLLNKPE